MYPPLLKEGKAPMKIECSCGHIITDGGDGLAHKAHVIPDASWFPLMDAVDDILLNRCVTATQRDAACTRLRALLSKAARHGWQCQACGRLYMDDGQRALSSYVPDGEASKTLFAP